MRKPGAPFSQPQMEAQPIVDRYEVNLIKTKKRQARQAKLADAISELDVD